MPPIDPLDSSPHVGAFDPWDFSTLLGGSHAPLHHPVGHRDSPGRALVRTDDGHGARRRCGRRRADRSPPGGNRARRSGEALGSDGGWGEGRHPRSGRRALVGRASICLGLHRRTSGARFPGVRDRGHAGEDPARQGLRGRDGCRGARDRLRGVVDLPRRRRRAGAGHHRGVRRAARHHRGLPRVPAQRPKPGGIRHGLRFGGAHERARPGRVDTHLRHSCGGDGPPGQGHDASCRRLRRRRRAHPESRIR